MRSDDAWLVMETGLVVYTWNKPVVDRQTVGGARQLCGVQELLRVLPDLARVSTKREPETDQVRL